MRAVIFFAVIFLTLAVFFAGCGGGGGGGVLDDVDFSESCGEDHVRQVDGGCLRICPEGQIDVDDVCTDIPDVEEDVSDGPPQVRGKSTKVKIISTDVITGCVYQVGGCGGELTASGGSKSYVWKVISGSLPEGLKFEPPAADAKNTSKALISGSPTKMTGTNSPATIKIGVEDAKDAEKHAEVSFSFTVTEKLNISAYEINGDIVNSIPIASDRTGDLELGFQSELRLDVLGHSYDYSWSINPGVKCFKDGDLNNGDACAGGLADKLTLSWLKVNANPSPGYDANAGQGQSRSSVFILPASDDYNGYRFENLVITVANNSGDKKSITIPSIVFRKDPCLESLIITSDELSKSPEVVRSMMLNKSIDSPVVFHAKGGRADTYLWVVTATSAPRGGPNTLDMVGPGVVTEGDSVTISGTMVPTKELSLEDYLSGSLGLQYQLSVKDECPNRAWTHASLNINVWDVHSDTIPYLDSISGIRRNISLDSSKDWGDWSRWYIILHDFNDRWVGVSEFKFEAQSADGDFSYRGKYGNDSSIKLDQITRIESLIYNDNFQYDGAIDIFIKQISIYTEHWIAVCYDRDKQVFHEDVISVPDISYIFDGYRKDSPWSIWHYRTDYSVPFQP